MCKFVGFHINILSMLSATLCSPDSIEVCFLRMFELVYKHSFLCSPF